MDTRPCFFCKVSGYYGPRRETLCIPCRENLSNFLIWLGRPPLPERELDAS